MEMINIGIITVYSKNELSVKALFSIPETIAKIARIILPVNSDFHTIQLIPNKINQVKLSGVLLINPFILLSVEIRLENKL